MSTLSDTTKKHSHSWHWHTGSNVLWGRFDDKPPPVHDHVELPFRTCQHPSCGQRQALVDGEWTDLSEPELKLA